MSRTRDIALPSDFDYNFEEKAIIGPAVHTIGDRAYKNDEHLKEIYLGPSVTSIGNEAFYGCKSLECINITNSVTTIGNRAFAWCHGLTTVTIPDNVTTIGNRAFAWCHGLTTVTIPDNVTTIKNRAFYECSELRVIFSNKKFKAFPEDVTRLPLFPPEKVYKLPLTKEMRKKIIFFFWLSQKREMPSEMAEKILSFVYLPDLL